MIQGQDQVDQILNRHIGFSFGKVGVVQQVDSVSYRITLPNEANHQDQVMITVSEKRYLDLPGSYGGRLTLDTVIPERILENRVLTDSVMVGDRLFTREYWAVYGGMGMWDCVLICYTEAAGRYFIVTRRLAKTLGKPGMTVNERPLTKQDLRMKAIALLQDTKSTAGQDFNRLLFSIRIPENERGDSK